MVAARSGQQSGGDVERGRFAPARGSRQCVETRPGGSVPNPRPRCSMRSCRNKPAWMDLEAVWHQLRLAPPISSSQRLKAATI